MMDKGAKRAGLVATGVALAAMLLLGAAVVAFDTARQFRGVPGYETLYQFDRKAIYFLSLAAVYAGWEQVKGRNLPVRARAALRAWALLLVACAGTLALAGSIAPLRAVAWWAAAGVLAAGLGGLGLTMLAMALRGRIGELGWGPHIALILAGAQLLFTSEAFRQSVQGQAVDLTLRLSSAIYRQLFAGDLATIDVGATISPLVVAGDFAVRIDPSCSGIIGVVIAALSFGCFFAFEWTRLRRLRAAALVAVALPTIFLANALRIALLMRIGASGHADVAVSGFHSHFGLLSLMALLGVALVLLGGGAFQRQGIARASPALEQQDSLNALVPLAVYLVAGMVLGLANADFDWLYPVRFLVGVAVLVPLLRRIRSVAGRIALMDVLCGVFVFVVWIALVPDDPAASETFRTHLASASVATVIGWVVIRAIGASCIVPLIEELAFRRGIQDWLARRITPLAPPIIATGGAVVLSSLVFAALHSQPLAALLAGLAYGGLYAVRSDLVAPMVAHAVTNGLLGVAVVALGQWSYW